MANAHVQHEEPNYMNIFWALAVLTVIEVGVVYLPASKLMIGFLLVALACTKAALVAMYFMHLKFERAWKYLLLAPTIIIAAALPVALRPDIGTQYYVQDVQQMHDYPEQQAANAHHDGHH